jgi:hypothetical protein
MDRSVMDTGTTTSSTLNVVWDPDPVVGSSPCTVVRETCSMKHARRKLVAGSKDGIRGTTTGRDVKSSA